MSILEHFGEPPWVQNGALERPGRPEMTKRDAMDSRAGGPFSPSARPALKIGPGTDFDRFRDLLASDLGDSLNQVS